MQFRPQVVAPRVGEPRGQGDQGEAGHQHRQRRAEGRRNPPTDVIITFSPDHFRHLDCEIDEIVSLSNGSGLSFGSLVTNDALFGVCSGFESLQKSSHHSGSRSGRRTTRGTRCQILIETFWAFSRQST